MEHKPIVEKLLAHYKDVHGKVNALTDINLIHQLLIDTNTQMGVCACANLEFGTWIYDDEWVMGYSLTSQWCEYPRRYTTKNGVLSSLQIRIDNLTKELELINAKTADNG